MEFKTIKENGQVERGNQKSRFICHVKRVESEEEARDFINTIKKGHYKATHNCSAFILGEKKVKSRELVMTVNQVVLLVFPCWESWKVIS